MRRVKNILTQKTKLSNDDAAIGIGSLIIFIAMILVAGIVASVIIQTMNSLQQQALLTGEQTMRDISSGVKVTHVSGYNNGSKITQLAVFVRTTAGSNDINLSSTYISLSDSAKHVVLNYTTKCFSSKVSNGLFSTLNSSNLTSTTYGIMVVRDIDSSCTMSSPTINDDDLVVLLINATKCFSGISTRTDVSGSIVPEYGINGVISFTTPSVYVDPIVELQ